MEVAAQPSTRVPMFSEPAQTIPVETLDGLACTHQARRNIDETFCILMGIGIGKIL